MRYCTGTIVFAAVSYSCGITAFTLPVTAVTPHIVSSTAVIPAVPPFYCPILPCRRLEKTGYMAGRGARDGVKGERICFKCSGLRCRD